MPKRWLSILFVAFAVIALNVMHSLPHHHHYGEAICFMAKCCENGHADADEHAHQHHTGSSGDDKCLVEDSSLFSFEQNETMKHRVASCHHDHSARAHLFFALCCLAAVALLYEAEIANHSSQYGECHACFYQSVHAGRDNGLRAPPCLNV